MRPLEMIAEWRKGCTVAGPLFNEIIDKDGKTSPADCVECTEGLINALEGRLREDERKNARWRGLAICMTACAAVQFGLALIRVFG